MDPFRFYTLTTARFIATYVGLIVPQVRLGRADMEWGPGRRRHLRPALERRNTTLYKLIASAYGEVWDDEDEEKQRSRESALALEKTGCIPTKGDDNLDRAREESSRSGQHKLQGIPQASLGLVEESEKGQSSSGPGSGSSPKETAAQEEESRAGGGGGGEGGAGP